MSQASRKRALSQLIRCLVWGGLAAVGMANGTFDEVQGPHASAVDEFHPERANPVEKAYGGEVVVHLSAMVRGLNRALVKSAAAHWISYEVHDTLILQDWELWDYRPSLATGWDAEDQIILKAEAASKYPQARSVGKLATQRSILYGKLEDGGDHYTLTGVSRSTLLGVGKSVRVAREDVQAVELGTVFTYYLPDNVHWHDGHLFDADGIIEKDGVQLELELILPAGNDASKDFGLRLQQAFEPLGIKLMMRTFEFSTFIERMLERNFDLVSLAAVPPLESDPEQLWHSKGGPANVKSSNVCGVMDAEVDRLIEAGQKELDDGKRAVIWKELHRRIYEDIHPNMFGLNSPRKFAMNKRLRGFQASKISPGYMLRRWYYPAGTEGTRPTREK